MKKYIKMATNFSNMASVFGWNSKKSLPDKCYGCGKRTYGEVWSWGGTLSSDDSNNTSLNSDHVCKDCQDKIVKKYHTLSFNSFEEYPIMFETKLGFNKKIRCPICHRHVKSCECEPTKAFRNIKK